MRPPTRRELDEWLPTLIRYSGWILTLVLVGFSLAGYYVEAAPGFVAATGMILYKSVRDAARNGDNGDHSRDLSDW